ncbi:hypothetical protein Sste5346_002389 [Sporothrix stenoceras]|uniref:Uncharacterized protein n=1 Tax=Sporothrix stenoceras TaxID=5173 RepID=A0ABR3ZME0_9PEZI
MRENFRLDCHCRLCELPPVDQKASDARLNIIAKGPVALLARPLPPPCPSPSRGGDGCGCVSDYRWKLRCVCMMMRLLRGEGIRNSMAGSLYSDAYKIAVWHGDVVRAKIFGARSLKECIELEGEESPTVAEIQPYVTEPKRHPQIGILSRTFPQPKDINDESLESEVCLWMGKKCLDNLTPEEIAKLTEAC